MIAYFSFFSRSKRKDAKCLRRNTSSSLACVNRRSNGSSFLFAVIFFILREPREGGDAPTSFSLATHLLLYPRFCSVCPCRCPVGTSYRERFIPGIYIASLHFIPLHFSLAISLFRSNSAETADDESLALCARVEARANKRAWPINGNMPNPSTDLRG